MTPPKAREATKEWLLKEFRRKFATILRQEHPKDATRTDTMVDIHMVGFLDKYGRMTCHDFEPIKSWLSTALDTMREEREKKVRQRKDLNEEYDRKLREEVLKEIEENIGLVRQWLNEDRITDPKKMVSNDDLKYWLLSHFKHK